MEQTSLVSKKQLNAALQLARSLWREARLIALGAPAAIVANEVALQARRRKEADRANVCSETVNGALYFIVMRDAVGAINNVDPYPNQKELYYAAAAIIGGYAIKILDAVFEGSNVGNCRI